MNRGDAQNIALTINIDGEPITEGYAEEIELTFNPNGCNHQVIKSLKKNEIYWNDLEDKYFTMLTQQDTFKMKAGVNTWQLRLLKDGEVISTAIGQLVLGEANSSEVLTNAQS